MFLLDQQTTRLGWIGAEPAAGKRVALLVPQYNEASQCRMESRLAYFREIAAAYAGEMDVILIDDGSTDDSLRLMEDFLQRYPQAFYLASVRPNANKVGALNLAALTIPHEFVILSDFDTDIAGYETIFAHLDACCRDKRSMGFYFRMVPFGSHNKVFGFQQLEYATLRSLYKLYAREGSVPVMPGAGACYKRTCLLEIYTGHSGLRSGEDREATLLGLKLGYRTQYIDKVAIFTRPPLTFENLVRQRVRWNLGYLETCFKESNCYAQQLKGASRLGLVFLMDIIGVVFMVLLPVLILLAGLKSWPLALAVIAGTYLSGVLLCLAALLISPLEFSEIRRKLPLLIAYYPVYKYSLGSVSWLRAMFVFYKKWGHSAQRIRAGKLQTS